MAESDFSGKIVFDRKWPKTARPIRSLDFEHTFWTPTVLIQFESNLGGYVTYQEKLEENVKDVKTWDELRDVIQEVAEEVVGYSEVQKKGEVKNEEIKRLSNQQKDVRMKMGNAKEAEELKRLRECRKRLMKELQQKLKIEREKEIDAMVKEIEQTKDDVKMFKAVKNLKRKEFENPTVHDKEGRCVTEPNQMYKIVNEHFKGQFYDKDAASIQRFEGPPRSLNDPISTNEITKTVNTMSNNKAANGIVSELIKYAPQIVHEKTANILNKLFEEHQDIDTGSGTLIPLQKPPPKKKGPVKNLRPINLLPVIRIFFIETSSTKIGKTH